jgi:hypothetical protein
MKVSTQVFLLLSGLTASYATLISSNVIISAIVEGCKTATNVENIFDGIISDYSCVLEKPTDSVRFIADSDGLSQVTGIRVYASSADADNSINPKHYTVEGLDKGSGDWVMITDGGSIHPRLYEGLDEHEYVMIAGGGSFNVLGARNIDGKAIMSSSNSVGDPELPYGESTFYNPNWYSKYRVTFTFPYSRDELTNGPQQEYMLQFSELELLGFTLKSWN